MSNIDPRLLEKLAEDLVDLHKVGGIELESWENALELVEYFYNTYHKVTIGKKKIK
jgi:hypothetical protein